MTRYIDRIHSDTPGIYFKAAHQIAANMARRPQQQRCRPTTEILKPVTHQRLLQLSRLDQIPVK